VVAEYLATRSKPVLDGILFRSSQTAEGRNLVLFNHASLSLPDDVPEGTEFDFWHGFGPPDDPDPTIMVTETIPPDPPAEPEKPKTIFGVPIPSPIPEPWPPKEPWLPDRNPALRLAAKDVEVLAINSIRYSTTSRMVLRSRRKKGESEIDEPSF
jgi:hypothetical protein